MNEMSFADFGKSEFIGQLKYVLKIVLTKVRDNLAGYVVAPYLLPAHSGGGRSVEIWCRMEESGSQTPMESMGESPAVVFRTAERDYVASAGWREDSYHDYYLYTRFEPGLSTMPDAWVYEILDSKGEVRWRNPDI